MSTSSTPTIDTNLIIPTRSESDAKEEVATEDEAVRKRKSTAGDDSSTPVGPLNKVSDEPFKKKAKTTHTTEDDYAGKQSPSLQQLWCMKVVIAVPDDRCPSAEVTVHYTVHYLSKEAAEAEVRRLKKTFMPYDEVIFDEVKKTFRSSEEKDMKELKAIYDDPSKFDDYFQKHYCSYCNDWYFRDYYMEGGFDWEIFQPQPEEEKQQHESEMDSNEQLDENDPSEEE